MHFGFLMIGISALVMGCGVAYVRNTSKRIAWAVLAVIGPVIFGVICGVICEAAWGPYRSKEPSSVYVEDLGPLFPIVMATIVGTPFALLMAICGWAAAYVFRYCRREIGPNRSAHSGERRMRRSD